MGYSRHNESGEVDPLLPEIVRAIKAAGVSRTMFGFMVAGDPTLIYKMERGRRILKPALRAAIEEEVALLNTNTAAIAMAALD